MKIAIVGAGVSGLTAAYKLHSVHEITLFEAGSYAGGHTNTVDVELDGERRAIDTGFIVYNDRTYPNFIALLDELGVASRPTTMSFSVRDEGDGVEYDGESLNGLFAQRRNLLRPGFHRMLFDIVRFNREARRVAERFDEEVTVGEFLERGRYSPQFLRRYLLPMGAAIWSCPLGTFADFPIRFVAEFYANHGLLNLTDRPQWRVIAGGSRTYVERMTASFRDRIRLNAPIASVRRGEDGVFVKAIDEAPERFDQVVFACHADQALRILGDDATAAEREALSAFPYRRNVAVLHTDATVLPRSRRAWASWNYRVSDDDSAAHVTYRMNRLQGFESKHEYLVTLNDDSRIDPSRILRRFEYEHPTFTVRRSAAQRRHAELCGPNRTSFCGAYWGNGFHEDGVTSALTVVKEIGKRALSARIESSATRNLAEIASG